MYENVFNFNSRPFTSTPFVKHYFAHEAIHGALGSARLSIDRASGPVVIVGGAGTGKTLMLGMLEEQYRSQFNVVNLGCARLDSRETLLQAILFELDQPINGMSESELRFAVINFLKSSDQSPNGVLLLVDEAHTLSESLLDELRLITNFVRDGQPRVRLVMAGNQRLEDNLSSAKLESLNQRISARCILGNMNRQDASNYVLDHVDRVGGSGAELFTESSLKTIHEVTGGCPRLVNQVCDHALILVGTRGEDSVSEDCVREAWSIVQSIPGLWTPSVTAETQTSNLNNKEEWTVIEFGSLDDEPAETLGDSTEQSQQIERASSTDVFENSYETGSDANGSVSVDEPSTEEISDEQVETQAVESTVSDCAADNDSQGSPVENESTDSTTVAGRGHIVPLTAASLQLAMAGLGSQSDEEQPSDGMDVDNSASESVPFEVMPQDSFVDDPEEKFVGHDAFDNVEAGPASVENERNESPSAAHDDVDQVESTFEQADLTNESLFQNQQATQTEVEHEKVTSEQELESPTSLEEEPGGEPESPDEATSGLVRSVVETVDPFAESFDDEEPLVDRYAPFVAYQNQSSLGLTSEDLSAIRPLDEGGPIESESSHVDSVADSNEPESSAFPSSNLTEYTPEVDENADMQCGEAQIDQVIQPALNLEEFVTHSPAEPEMDPRSEQIFVPAEVAEANGSDESLQYDGHSESMTVEAVQEEQIETPVAAESDSILVGDAQEPAVVEQPRGSTPEQERENSIENEAASDKGFHEHITEARSEEIEREAEAILKRLAAATGDNSYVSHETSGESGVHEMQEQIQSPVASLDSNRDAVADLVRGLEPQADPVSNPNMILDKQNEALEETQRILDEILEQKNLLAQQTKPATDSLAFNNQSMEKQASLSSEGRDDRNIIIVNEAESQREVVRDKEESVPFPSTPVSTGRAERMDYQQLFDQLRNASDATE